MGQAIAVRGALTMAMENHSHGYKIEPEILDGDRH
jgi:hypothetical protein